MGRPKKELTLKQKDLIKDLYLNTELNKREIARELKIGEYKVNKLVKELKLGKKPPKKQDKEKRKSKSNNLNLEKLKELKVQGKSNKEIASYFLVSEETIRLKLLKHNFVKKQPNKVNKNYKGFSKHPLYKVWRGMNERCHSELNPGYAQYGKKGVFVCKEWNINNELGLINFIEDMYLEYKKALLINKKVELDKDKLCKDKKIKFYSKETCCWITPEENKQLTKKIPQKSRFSSREKIVLYYKGEEREFKDTTDFCKETNISGAVVKDWYEGSLQESFKGWHIDKLKSMDQELDQ